MALKNCKEKNIFVPSRYFIGDELHAATDAFIPTDSGTAQTRALNVYMAPDGYTWSLLRANPTASICGITLPPELGGHPA